MYMYMYMYYLLGYRLQMEREYMQKKDNNVDIDDLFKMKVTMIIYFTCYYMYNELIQIE